MSVIEIREQLGELSALCVGDRAAATLVVVLHGREMEAADLAPFVSSMARDAYWVFPDAPLPASRARTWWPVDSEARLRRLTQGPMELSAMDPPGRAEARAQLGSLLVALDAAHRPFVLVGFSQGGMLAMDYVLHGGLRPAALALLSSTRIALADWQARATVIANLRVLVCHGTREAELSFAAGELLRDFATDAGATTTWLPFEGGHELPFVVWRALKKLVTELRELREA
ncbi:esterase [soil metagenome]